MNDIELHLGCFKHVRDPFLSCVGHGIDQLADLIEVNIAEVSIEATMNETLVNSF
jgi:hypothetical protein